MAERRPEVSRRQLRSGCAFRPPGSGLYSSEDRAVSRENLPADDAGVPRAAAPPSGSAEDHYAERRAVSEAPAAPLPPTEMGLWERASPASPSWSTQKTIDAWVNFISRRKVSVSL